MPEDGDHTDEFVRRHIGISEADLAEMLRVLNVGSLDELMDQTVPRDIRLTRPLDLPSAVSEHELLAELEQIAARNRLCRSFIGMGYADCVTPKVILRNILQNPGWYTAYTPYQAEISQGRLEALLNFQTMIIDLTGLQVANASLLDEGTAAAEAMAMLFSIAEHDRSKAFFVSTTCHPQTIEVVRTRAEPLGIDVIVGDHREWLESRLQPADSKTSASNQPAKPGTPARPIFGAIVQYPATDGAVYDYRVLCERARAEGARVVAAADLLSLTVLQPPGEWGADVAVGNSQRFGVPLGYGGPHAAYFATRNEFVRKMPGRLIGVAQDAHGRPAFRMALQTREQHIRRDKATSNICTAQVLLAVVAGMYAVYHGPRGLRAIAERVHGLATTLAAGLRRLGVAVRHTSFFDTVCVEGAPGQVAEWHAAAHARRMNLRSIDERSLSITLDETTGPDDVQEILAVFAAADAARATGHSDAHVPWTAASTLPPDASTQYSVLSTEPTSDAAVPRDVSVPSPHVSSAGGRGSVRAAASHFHHDADPVSRTSRAESSDPADPLGDSMPTALRRTSLYLTHPVFNRYQSETEMLRYLKSLENRDFSLTHGMMPLGSCTMKLNATAEMIPVTWPLFNRLHPFAPTDQAAGYQVIFQDLQRWLGEITGLPGVSLQPNAGSQGEYAGLLVIRRYHASRGHGQRSVCLIPASAHGTNPASAVMAGYKVVVVACDERGNIDLADLEAKARQHRNQLAALMVTYPSTYGVFEEEIRRICSTVHEHGGQVYLDGANMNAQVGLCRPGDYGADVCHLNLHKTFCIPHGGGGPGMGPIAVAAHLADFLPTHPAVPTPPAHGASGPDPVVGGRQGIGPVSAAPWGSASILLISWAYIKLMGTDGLRQASKVAILNANYVAERLHVQYPVLYRGRLGRVAHECIIDPRPLKKSAGVEVEDIAKRLMDYGFHAPTISFPVPGAMMVEPTESESKAELDRFCEALVAIREEIREIEQGRTPRDENLLKNAPHTAETVTASEWSKPYSRERAAFPTLATRRAKFWPSVGRINNALGDRNLICACPPTTDY